MAKQQSTNYARGSPAPGNAPIPFATQKNIGSADYDYQIGQLVYEEQNDRWLIYSGRATWDILSNSNGNISALKDNAGNLAQPVAAGFINVVGDGISTVTTASALPTNNTLTITTTQAINTTATPTFASIDLVTGAVVNYIWTCTNATSGAGSWQSLSAEGVVTTLKADDATTATPSSGVVTVSGGSTGLTTTASSHTLSLTGTLVLASGGTSASLTASNGGIFYSTASAGAILPGTATARQMLQSGASTTPAWSTTTWPATTSINTILYSSSASVIGQITAADNGVLISGTTGIPSWLANGTAGYVLTANSAAPPSWQSASASGAVTTINGNSGSATPSSGVITVTTGASNASGTAKFTGSGSTVTMTATDASSNTGWGASALSSASLSGSANCAFGYSALAANTSAGANTCMGYEAGFALTTGGKNTLIGSIAGQNYTSSESNNIILGNNIPGTATESYVTRIGNTTGSSNPGDVNKCFIQGIYGQNSSGFSSPKAVYIDTSTGQLGYGVSGGVTSVTGTANQITASPTTGAVVLTLSSTIVTPGTLAINGLTTGSVLFSAASSVVSQDNANFFWDATNHRLGLTDTAPGTKLSVVGNAQIGYTTGTTAPSSGLAVSGQTRIGTATLQTDASLALGANMYISSGQMYAFRNDGANGNTYWMGLPSGSQNTCINVAGDTGTLRSVAITTSSDGTIGGTITQGLTFTPIRGSVLYGILGASIQAWDGNASALADILAFYTNSTERMRLLAGGNFCIGQITAAASGTLLTVNSAIATAPVSSATATGAFITTMTAGSSYQNTTGYDVLINISVVVTAATTATIALGVGSATSPTQNTVVTTFSVAAAATYNFSAYVPNNYYVEYSTTGTITVGSVTVQCMGV